MSGDNAQTIAATESLLARLMDAVQSPAGAFALVLVFGALVLSLVIIIRLYYRERRGYTEDDQLARQRWRADQQEEKLTEARTKLILDYQQEVKDLRAIIETTQAAVADCHADSDRLRHALHVLYVVLSGDHQYANKLGGSWEEFIGGKITVQALTPTYTGPERRKSRR